MKVAIMQPYFFPYLGYFQLIHAVDRFIVYDDVNFIKRGWINRNQILLKNKPHLFTVPCLKPSQNRQIKDTLIDPSDSWKNKLAHQVLHSYRRAPFFEAIYPLFTATLRSPCISISELAVASVNAVLEYLEMPKEIRVCSEQKYNNQDMERQQRLIDIVNREGGTVYINAAGGKSLYSKHQFQKHNIELLFLQPSLPTYPQFSGTFLPGLSVLDALMFNHKAQVREMLACYSLE